MNFNQLEAFVGVVKYRSFSKAAEALYLSQPTISAYVHALEEELGIQLIIRSTRGIEMTQEGTKLFFYARDIIYTRDAAVAELKQTAHGTKGIVNIAASSVPAQCLIPCALTELKKQFPDIFPVIHQCSSGEIARKLTDLSCEVGVSGAVYPRDGCQYTAILSEPLAIITPNTPEYGRITLKSDCHELLDLPFIEREPGSGTRKQYERFLASVGLDIKSLNIVAQVQGTEAVIQSVKSGLGVSIVSCLAASPSIKNGEIRGFMPENPMLTRDIFVVCRKNHRFSPEAKAFIAMLMNFVERIEFM